MKFKNIDKKKAGIVGGLFVMVVVAAVVNYNLTVPPLEIPEPVEVSGEPAVQAEDAFEVFKLERSEQREQEIGYIDSVISSGETEDTVKSDAQSAKLEIVERMDKELTAEGVIKTKLGMQCVVSVAQDNVNIVVDSAELAEAQVAQIVEIVVSETGVSPQNIKVMPNS